VNADIPPQIDVGLVDEFDANAGPLGAKGIGELGATGVASAVANAVYDGDWAADPRSSDHTSWRPKP
jgi:xanthine dehydrogenase YagR molybdenum-binding subunit